MPELLGNGQPRGGVESHGHCASVEGREGIRPHPRRRRHFYFCHHSARWRTTSPCHRAEATRELKRKGRPADSRDVFARSAGRSSQLFAPVILGALLAILAVGYFTWGDERESSKLPLLKPSGEYEAAIARMERSAARTRVRIAASILERYRHEHGSSYLGATVTVLQRLSDQESVADQPLHVHVVRTTKTSFCIESRYNEAVASKSGPSAEVVDSPCPR